MSRGKNNSTKYAILGMLSLKPMTGYDIKQFAAGSIGHFWSESYGQIYPTLSALAKEELVLPERAKSRGQRRRQLYRITKKGRVAIKAWLGQDPRTESPRNELLLKLFFSFEASPSESLRHIEAFEREQQQKLSRYKFIEKQIMREHAGHPGLPYWLTTLSFGGHRCEALIKWSEESMARLSTTTISKMKVGKV